MMIVGALLVGLNEFAMSTIIGNFTNGTPILTALQFPDYYNPFSAFIVGMIVLLLGVGLMVTSREKTIGERESHKHTCRLECI